MENTSSWTRLFGNAATGQSPSIGPAVYGSRTGSRGIMSLPALGSPSSSASGIVITSSTAAKETTELVFERVDLMTVCNALQAVIAASPGGSALINSLSSSSSGSLAVAPSSTPEMPTQALSNQVSGGTLSAEYLERVGSANLFKDTILIRKCSLAEGEDSRTSHLGNLIRCLPACFKNIVLTDCLMTEAAIASLCYGVLGSNHIISLTLKHNTLGSDRIKGIATGLVTNKILQSLEISFSDSIQLILPYLSSSIDDNHTLNKLILSNDRLTDISSLTNSMKRVSPIVFMDLSSNYLDRSQASHIAEMLLVNSTLEHLDLSSNVFGDHGAQLIALALEQNAGLRTLKLESCSLLDLGVSSLGRALKFNNTLTHLSLAGNTVSDLSCAAFIESLKVHRNETLQELQLDGPTPHMLLQLVDLLQRNRQIAAGTSSLLFPQASTQGVISNSAPSPSVPPLNQLMFASVVDLRWNIAYSLTPKLMNELFSLAVRLTQLNLSRCGIAKLSPKISCLTSLKLLDLRSNHLRTICPEIAACRQLEVLKLSDNHLESLPAEISQISSLVELHIYGNPMTYIPDAITQIDGILEGPVLDTSLAGMNVYRYHHVNFQNSMLMQYLRSIHQAVSNEQEFNYGGISVVGPEKSGKTSFLNCLAQQATKKFKQWEGKNGPYQTFLGLGDAVSAKYRSSTLDSPFDPMSTFCVSTGDFMLLHEDAAKKAPTPHHIIAQDFSGSPAFRTLSSFLISPSDQTLHLVVFNLLEYPAKSASLEQWIKTIQARSGSNAAIILIGTHSETKFGSNKTAKRDVQIALKKQYPMVVDIHFYDLKAKPEKVAKALAPIMASMVTSGRNKCGWGQRYPTSYVRAIGQVIHLRDELDSVLVPNDALVGSLRAVGVAPNQMEHLQTKLTALGLIKCWPQDHKLKDISFVDPSFLYLALSEIVGPHLAQKISTGTIGKKALDSMWSPNTKPRMRPVVLKILESFELLAIDSTHLDERLTIPHLLPADSGSLTSYWNPQGRAQLISGRSWEFSMLLPGIVAKCIGACLSHSYLSFSTMWQNGIVVRLGDECAKLEANLATNVMSVHHFSDFSGTQLARLLFQIVQRVVTNWVHPSETKVFALITLTSGATHSLPFSELSEALARNQTHVSVLGESIAISRIAPDLTAALELTSVPAAEDRVFLGKGEFGSVFKGIQNGQSVLFKEAPLVADLSYGDQERGMALMMALTSLSKRALFVSQLTSLQHANLVPFRGITHDPHLSSFYAFTEGQTLGAFLSAYPNSSLNTKLKILLDVAFAIEHLHRQTPILMHGNLKPSNVMIQKLDETELGVVAKTTDYGLWPEIRQFNGDVFQTSTWMWQAPEVFIGGAGSAKSDSYSFGMLIWYMWVCHDQSLGAIQHMIEQSLDPYACFKTTYPFLSDLQHAIHRRNLRPRLPTDNRMRPGYQTLELLVRACWKANPDERPDFTSIIKKLLQAQEHVGDSTAQVGDSSKTTPKGRSIFSVNMKQLQHSRTWQLLASYVYKSQPYAFSSATSVSFKIPPTSVSPTLKPTSLIPAPESALSFLTSSTFWMGSAKNFVVLLDLKDGKTSNELKLDVLLSEAIAIAPDRPTINFVAATPTDMSKKPTMRADSRGSAKRSQPPPMINNTVNSGASSPSTSPPLHGSSPLAASSSSGSLGPSSSSPTLAAKKSTNQRIIGSIVVGVAIWSFCEDKTLTISLGPKAISKVEIGKIPICVARSGDFGYVGCGEGCILELDLTRDPKPTATSIDAYLLRNLDVQGHPVYSMLIDEANIWVGTKGEVMVLDRLSSHRYTSWTAHTDRIVSILKMPDGRAVWTASDDRTIKIWAIKASTASNIGAIEVVTPSHPDKTLEHHTQRIKDMALCGNYVASIAGENTAIWDTVTGTVVKILSHTGFANALAVIDSSTIVTISSTYSQQTGLYDNYIQLWNNGLDTSAVAGTDILPT
jgi:Leucine-rich repeat (LRR) protein